MKKRTLRTAFALSLLLAAYAAPGARQKPAQAGTVVFAVEKYESNVMIEPAFVYRGGAFVAPPVDSPSNSFTREYFRPGRKYRLLSGGGEAGSVTVRKYLEPGCVGLVAEAAAETPARLGGRAPPQSRTCSEDLAGYSSAWGKYTTAPPRDLKGGPTRGMLAHAPRCLC